MAKLFFMGDSITAGAWDEQGGWVSRLIAQIMTKTATSTRKNKGFYCISYNLGVSGDTVADIIRRLEKEILTRTYGDTADSTVQLVFAVGVNDSVHLIDEGKLHASNDIFEKDVQTLIHMAKKITSNISFIGLLPVTEEKVNPCPWMPSIGYQNTSIKRCNDLIKKNCLEQDVRFLDLYNQWETLENLDDYLSDGLHPNSKGHALMANQIKDFILNDDFERFHTKN